VGLGTTYDVYLGLTEKRLVDFLLVLIELFSLGVTVEALRAKIDKTSSSAIAERSCCRVGMAKSGRLELGDNILRTL